VIELAEDDLENDEDDSVTNEKDVEEKKPLAFDP
jgi:hypothetical protein